MKIRFAALSALLALTAIPMAAQAVVLQFNATLAGSNENPPSGAMATGLATLSYDTADNTYDFSMGVFNLTGGSVAGTAASAFHIHAAAAANENGPVRVSLDNPALFAFMNSGSTLLVGGSNIAAPGSFATAATAANQGYASMSFLQALQSGLAYVNVHTALNPGGAVRGQLLQVSAVSAVPEPGTYAMMLGGLALLGVAARRRRG